MSKALDSLIFGIRRLFAAGVEQPAPSALDFSAAFSVTPGTTPEGTAKATIALASGGGGGAGALISRTRYVDKRTAVAEDDQTGSIGAPFATFAAALASLQTLADTETGDDLATYGYSIGVFPGDYSGETVPAWEPPSESGMGLAVFAAVPCFFSANVGPSTLVQLPALAGSNSTLTVFGCQLNGCSGWSGVAIKDGTITGTCNIPGSRFVAVDCNVYQPNLTCGAFDIQGGALSCTDNAIHVSFTLCTIIGCYGASVGAIVFTGSAGSLEVDAVSNQALGSLSITNGTKTKLT